PKSISAESVSKSISAAPIWLSAGAGEAASSRQAGAVDDQRGGADSDLGVRRCRRSEPPGSGPARMGRGAGEGGDAGGDARLLVDGGAAGAGQERAGSGAGIVEARVHPRTPVGGGHSRAA